MMKGSSTATAALLATGDGDNINGADLRNSVIPGADSGLPHASGEDNAPGGVIERELMKDNTNTYNKANCLTTASKVTKQAKEP